MATTMKEAKKEMGKLCALLHLKYTMIDGLTEDQAHMVLKDAIDLFHMGIAAQRDFGDDQEVGNE